MTTAVFLFLYICMPHVPCDKNHSIKRVECIDDCPTRQQVSADYAAFGLRKGPHYQTDIYNDMLIMVKE